MKGEFTFWGLGPTLWPYTSYGTPPPQESVMRFGFTLLVLCSPLLTSACTKDDARASSPKPMAQFEPPRSLGTPADEVARVSGTIRTSEGGAARLGTSR
jgi:hypothetical protein